MVEETSKEPEAKENRELKFSQEQYEMLLRCSEKKDMTEWNEWRNKYPFEDILLEGADLLGAHLCGVNLTNYGGIASQPTVHLENATLIRANLDRAHLNGSDLQHADLCNAILSGAELNNTILKNANFQSAQLIGRLSMGKFHLRGACFDGAQLESADFKRSIVDSSTSFWTCTLNQETDFRDVALGSVQLEQEKKQLLEYNIRRMNWEDWYKEHPRLKWLVKLFWWISDYGLSTKRIIYTFFGLAIIFANIYYHWGRIAPPGIVGNLFIDRTSVVIPWQLVPLRTLYFSIVTMTTLGFGDMYAYPTSWFGHILLMVQVLLGYVLLGALITRFAVLFTAGGPAGKFAGESKRDSGASKK